MRPFFIALTLFATICGTLVFQKCQMMYVRHSVPNTGQNKQGLDSSPSIVVQITKPGTLYTRVGGRQEKGQPAAGTHQKFEFSNLPQNGQPDAITLTPLPTAPQRQTALPSNADSKARVIRNRFASEDIVQVKKPAASESRIELADLPPLTPPTVITFNLQLPNVPQTVPTLADSTAPSAPETNEIIPDAISAVLTSDNAASATTENDAELLLSPLPLATKPNNLEQVLAEWKFEPIVRPAPVQEQQTSNVDLEANANDFVAPSSAARGSSKSAAASPAILEATTNETWWQQRMSGPILNLEHHEFLSVQDAIYQALENSQYIRWISQDPAIQETEIDLANAQFDPTLLAKSIYNDKVDPVGNTLTTGGLPFLKDNIWTGTAALKRRTATGADVGIEQKLGFQNSNSRFFTPQDQGTAVLSLNFEQPLLRNGGRVVNRTQILIAETSADVAWDDFSVKLQDELVKVVETYWTLYAARATFLQKQRGVELGLATLKMVEGRQGLDTQAIQLVQAKAAVGVRRVEMANAYRDIRNAEAELRRLLGIGNLSHHQNSEIIPSDIPTLDESELDIVRMAEVALQNRPELRRAIKQTQVVATENQFNSNQILPDLSLIFGTYVAGLAGDSGIETAWQRQFKGSTPGYTAGLSFEFPWRNRAARSRQRKSELQLVQAHAIVEQATLDITTDVQKAYWRMKSAVETIETARLSLEAANAELGQNEKRWETFALTEGDWSEGQTQSLILDQLLATQLKVVNAENIVARAEQELKSAQVFVRRSLGTLLECARPSELIAPIDYLPAQFPDSTIEQAPGNIPSQNENELSPGKPSAPTVDESDAPRAVDPSTLEENPEGMTISSNAPFWSGRTANALDKSFGSFGWSR
jgi:outer membrane protein TolC